MPLISIITVCFNTEASIRQTIESVLRQTSNEYEYLIVDGKSTDKTLAIANEYLTAFESKQVQYRVVSEKDSGIYNAMNKGTNLSNGDWLLFLNAGDELCKENVIDKLCAGVDEAFDIIYGKAIYRYLSLSKLMNPRPVNQLGSGMVFCHQSTIIKRNIMEKYRYDESYRIAADYNFFCQCYRNGQAFKELDFPVAIFELGGTSSDPVAHLKEEFLVQYNNCFLTEEEYNRKIQKTKMRAPLYSIRNLLMRFIPKKALLGMKQKKYVRMGYTREEQSSESVI